MTAPQMLLDPPGVLPAPLPGVAPAPEREESERTVRRQLRLLASRLRRERALAAARAELLGSDPLVAGPTEIARILSTRLGLLCEVTVPAARGDERLLTALARATEPGPIIVALAPRGGRRRAVVEFGDGSERGLIALAESGRPLNDGDLQLLGSAASFLTGVLRAQRRLAAAEVEVGEALVRDAVHGTDSPASLRERAAAVGLDLGHGAALCLLADPVAPLTAAEVRAAARRVAPRLADHLASDAAGVLLLAFPVGGARAGLRSSPGRATSSCWSPACGPPVIPS